MKSVNITILAVMLAITTASHAQVTTITSPTPAPHKGSTPTEGYVDKSKWKLHWSEEFNCNDKEFDERWDSANHASLNLYCSRWRENAVIENGTLKLVNKRESRGGQDWTSGSVWTKEHFLYGYYECRYKYAAATSTNNSFWIMTRGNVPEGYKRFEIDINEGHYPNNVNSNIHNWTDVTIDDNGKKIHPLDPKAFIFGAEPGVNIELETPIVATKLRISTSMTNSFRLNEVRAFSVSESEKYPSIMDLEEVSQDASLVNFISLPTTNLSCSTSESSVDVLVDGKSSSGWKGDSAGDKWVMAEFDSPKTIGCIQFSNGWQYNDTWKALLSNYKIEYYDGKSWHIVSTMDVTESVNFAEEYHTLGLEWNEKELIFYLDGNEIRRSKNEYCHYPAPVFLSLAIIKWDGPLDEARLDGTFMEVDYVRIYKEK